MSAPAESRAIGVLLGLALLLGASPARAQARSFPDIALWAYPGAYQAGPDSIREQTRTITLRWMRDPAAEARRDFGGYRIYRVFNTPDTSRMQLIRRFSKQFGDSLIMWHFPNIDASTPDADRIATFVDPDSSGTFFKRCRRDTSGRCYSPGDSVIVLIPPPGPHDGFRTWYSITYEGRNITSNDYLDLFVADTANCPNPDPSTCPNINHKARNMTLAAVEPTAGPTSDVQRVSVVPNPFRAAEAWDQQGAHEVHFINLPPQATITIYTTSGDRVVVLNHDDSARDFERWDLKNGKGQPVSSGIYMYRVEAGSFFQQHRFVVIR